MTTLLSILLVINAITNAQNYQLYKGDTINKIDAANLKQGKWIYFGNMKNEPGYAADQIVEEGQFKDNRKEGLWVKYFPNKQKESEIMFVSNRPNGAYKIYYENGQLQEQGEWKNNRNTGNFKRFYDNGVPQQEFIFNQGGKRDGVQKYYYENGQLMIVGEIKEGKEIGEFVEYHPNGDVKAKRVYDEAGVLNPAKTQIDIPPKNKVVVIEDKPEVEKVAPVVKDLKQNEGEEKAKPAPFNGNGEATLYNKNKQITQKGFFKNFRLIDGLYYKYDENGILTNIERYKNGKYVGDAPIEEDKQ